MTTKTENKEIYDTFPKWYSFISFYKPLTKEIASVFLFKILPSKNFKVNRENFIDLLMKSFSLDCYEKLRVINKWPELSETQINALIDVFEKEKIQFLKIQEEHPDDIQKLYNNKIIDWFYITNPDFINVNFLLNSKFIFKNITEKPTNQNIVKQWLGYLINDKKYEQAYNLIKYRIEENDLNILDHSIIQYYSLCMLKLNKNQEFEKFILFFQKEVELEKKTVSIYLNLTDKFIFYGKNELFNKFINKLIEFKEEDLNRDIQVPFLLSHSVLDNKIYLSYEYAIKAYDKYYSSTKTTSLSKQGIFRLLFSLVISTSDIEERIKYGKQLLDHIDHNFNEKEKIEWSYIIFIYMLISLIIKNTKKLENYKTLLKNTDDKEVGNHIKELIFFSGSSKSKQEVNKLFYQFIKEANNYEYFFDSIFVIYYLFKFDIFSTQKNSFFAQNYVNNIFEYAEDFLSEEESLSLNEWFKPFYDEFFS